MKRSFGLLLFILGSCMLCSCKEKDKAGKVEFVSALSLIQNQVSEVDTSLYSIRRYVEVDSTRTDTVYFPREQFRVAAADFLSIPDISTKEYHDRFKETKDFDQDLNRVILAYLPVDPEKEFIQRQEVLITPDLEGGKVSSIIINTLIYNRDSAIQKRMLWRIDESFQVVTIKQYPGKPEFITKDLVSWTDKEFK